MTQQGSGADLARQALAAARANAKSTPTPGPKKTRPAMRVHRGERTDPQGLAGILGRLTAEQGWTDSLGGGNLIDQWPTLCPQYVGLVQPVHYDDDRGRLDLRPVSHVYAAQLRLLGGQLAKQINDKLGRPWHDALEIGYTGIELMQGCAEGADTIGRDWAIRNGVLVRDRAADWEAPCAPDCRPGHRRRRRDGTTFCPQAGHRRNQTMVDEEPLLFVAAATHCTLPKCRTTRPHDSHGTADCIRRAEKAGIPVWRVPD